MDPELQLINDFAYGAIGVGVGGLTGVGAGAVVGGGAVTLGFSSGAATVSSGLVSGAVSGQVGGSIGRAGGGRYGETIGSIGAAVGGSIGGAQTAQTLCRYRLAPRGGTYGPGSLGAAERTPKVLQTGGHTITDRTRKALGLTQEQAKRAMEGLKDDLLQGARHHQHKILDNGDILDSRNGELLGNLFDYLF